jgi:hypothetical protein
MATRLPDIDQVIPMGPTDDQLMADLRCVLDQHGALERFGITLLHQHFDLGDDEVLVQERRPHYAHADDSPENGITVRRYEID